jgi:hypothetical protein
MRRALALAAVFAICAADAASAETWKKYVEADNGTAWSYDADYAYKDRSAANLGPSGPGKPDGVGSVVAIDCTARNMIVLGSYTPSKPLALSPTWRSDAPKKAAGSDNEALLKAVCAGNFPSK